MNKKEFSIKLINMPYFLLNSLLLTNEKEIIDITQKSIKTKRPIISFPC